MRLVSLIAFGLSLALASLACGKKDEDDGDSSSSETENDGSGEYATGAAKGKVFGTPWVFANGRAIPTDDDDLTKPFLLQFLSKKYEFPCQELSYQADDDRRVDFELPLKVGEVDLTDKAKFAFVNAAPDPEEAVPGPAGKVQITAVDKAKVRGRVNVRANDLNRVNGIFVIDRCCPSEDRTSYAVCTE